MSFFKAVKQNNVLNTLSKNGKGNIMLNLNFQSTIIRKSILQRNFSYSSDPNYSVKNKFKIISKLYTIII